MGIDLNEKQILEFKLNPELEQYISEFQLLSDSDPFFEQHRENLIDLLSATANSEEQKGQFDSIEDLIDKLIKWQIKNV